MRELSRNREILSTTLVDCVHLVIQASRQCDRVLTDIETRGINFVSGFFDVQENDVYHPSCVTVVCFLAK